MAGKEDKSKYKYECPHCGRKFKSPQTLKGHILVKHKFDVNVKKDEGIKNNQNFFTNHNNGGIGMETKEVEKAVEDVKNTLSNLSKKVETQASSIDKVINSIPDMVARSIESLEQKKREQEERIKKEQEMQKKMQDVEEIIKHKDDLLSFCKTNPKLCKIEIDKIIPKDKNHLPHKTVAETLACPQCGPALLRGISKSLIENEEFGRKFIDTLRENKADTKLEELINLGKSIQKGEDNGTGKPKEEGQAPKEEHRKEGLF